MTGSRAGFAPRRVPPRTWAADLSAALFCDCGRVAAPHRRLVAGPQATLSAARTGTGAPVQPILGLFVRPTRDGEARGRVHILAAANDGMSRFGMMQRCRIGRSTQGNRQAKGQNETHNFYSDRATAAHMCCAVSTGTIGSGFTIGHVGATPAYPQADVMTSGRMKTPSAFRGLAVRLPIPSQHPVLLASGHQEFRRRVRLA